MNSVINRAESKTCINNKDKSGGFNQVSYEDIDDMLRYNARLAQISTGATVI